MEVYSSTLNVGFFGNDHKIMAANYLKTWSNEFFDFTCIIGSCLGKNIRFKLGTYTFTRISL